MELARRKLLAGLAGAGLAPLGLSQLVFASTPKAAPILIVVHQRGACDGLNLISPADDPQFVSERVPELRVAASGTNAGLVLDHGPLANVDFRLHPSAPALHEIYKSGNLAFIHAAGITDANRSHFVATDMMERGVADVPSLARIPSGWLARYMQSSGMTKALGHVSSVCASGAVSGEYAALPAAVAIPNLDYGYGAPGGDEAQAVLHRLYADGSGFLGDVARRTLATFDVVGGHLHRDPHGKLIPYTPSGGASYEKAAGFGNGLKTLAQLIKMDVGLIAGSVEIGGWDTHEGQPGRFKICVDQLSTGLGAFWNDLSAYHHRLVIVMMTEFGRRLRGNRSTGTDHGRASVMAVLGGNVIGGKIYGAWPGLAPEQLEERVDLAVKTDYRSVLTEVLQAFGDGRQANPFPGFTPQHLGLFSLGAG